MSHVVADPEMMAVAASELATIGSNLDAAHASAAAHTTAVVAAAGAGGRSVGFGVAGGSGAIPLGFAGGLRGAEGARGVGGADGPELGASRGPEPCRHRRK